MTAGNSPAGVAEWATRSGDIWARRWRDTDAALEEVSGPLLSAVAARVPKATFNAFEIGCGPGSTTISVADAFPEAAITACDISPSLARIAEERLRDRPNVRVIVGDAAAVAVSEGPFDLLFSRHGVMFFPDPVRAFQDLRRAATAGASIVFSCFRSWDLNPWASELANAAAGRELPAPGREPGGFAFADPDHVRQILGASGWTGAEAQEVDFTYSAGRGENAVADALSFMADLGPASRVLDSMPEEERQGGIDRMRRVIERHFDGSAVTFSAAVWIWSAAAAPSAS